MASGRMQCGTADVQLLLSASAEWVRGIMTNRQTGRQVGRQRKRRPGKRKKENNGKLHHKIYFATVHYISSVLALEAISLLGYWYYIILYYIVLCYIVLC